MPLEIPPQSLNTAPLGGEVVVVTPSEANTSPTVIEDAPSFDAPGAQHLSIDPIIPVAPSSSSFYNTGRIGGERKDLHCASSTDLCSNISPSRNWPKA